MKNKKELKGIFKGNQKGFGFVKIENAENEIYVSRGDTKDAIDGDEVIIKLLENQNREDKNPEGKIVRVLSHSRDTIVGTFQKSKNFGFVVPDDKKMNTDIYISKKNSKKAKNNQKVVVQITKYPQGNKSAEGKIVEIIGHINQAGVDMLSLIKEYNLAYEFPQKVIEEVKSLKQEIAKKDIPNRLDLREKEIFTIDGEDAKDLDDAVAVEKLENGNYLLNVSIADVSYYVKESSLLDKEAMIRGTSIYMLDRVIPMLPTSLSNGICSLNPQVDRLTLSVFMEITGDGNVVSHKLCKSVICSKERMTYNNVNKMLEDGDEELCERYKHILPTLKLMEDLAQILKNKRTLRGAIQFDFPESHIVVNENGEPIEIEKEVRGTSNKMIEEFMLSANETIAEYAFWSEIPFVYRNHEAPTLEKIMTFNEFILHFGLSFKGKIDRDTPIHPKALQQILDTVKDTPQERIVASTMLHSLMKAKYSEENLGHFGLAAKYYCHFTSPIRRYPDLAIHRILKDFLDGKVTGNRISYLAGYVSAASKHSSDCEVNAETAERDVDDLMKTAYMSSFIGQTFEGVVANVTNFGMFVELENSVEGLIRVENMTDDYYEYDEKVNTLTGRRKQKSYTTGDVVNIVVARTDILSRQIDFVLAKDADRKLLKKFAKPIEIPKSEKHGKKSKRKKSFKKYNKKKK